MPEPLKEPLVDVPVKKDEGFVIVASPIKQKVVQKPSAVITMIYLIYKSNMIGNHQLKSMLDLVGKDMPDDLAGYLVKEASKV